MSASIPGLPYSQFHVALKEGADPFKAALRFKERYLEAFGTEATAQAYAESQHTTQRSATAPTSIEAPKCNTHNRRMKASEKVAGQWYCTAKLGDGSYCKEKVEAAA
jgi:hypothetical protein